MTDKGRDVRDEQGNCIQCGHPSDPHIIIAYDVTDFSKGGERRCPVEGCTCYSTVSFNVKPAETLPAP